MPPNDAPQHTPRTYPAEGPGAPPGGPPLAQLWRSTRRLRRFLRVVLVLCVALLVVAAVAWLALDSWATGVLKRAEARLGPPPEQATQARVASSSTWQEAVNAASAREYRDAIWRLPRLWTPRPARPADTLTDKTLIDCRDFTEGAGADFLELFAACAISVRESDTTVNLRGRGVHRAFEGLVFAAWHDAASGNDESALARIADAATLLAAPSDDSLLSKRLSIAEMLIRMGLTGVLWQAEASSAALEDLQARLRHLEDTLRPGDALSARLRDELDYYEYLIDGEKRRFLPRIGESALGSTVVSFLARPYLKIGKARMITGALPLLESAEDPPPAVLVETGTAVRDHTYKEPPFPDRAGGVRAMMDLYVRGTLMRARLRAAAAALAALRYKRDTGEWPISVEDLAPDYMDEVPIDPFSGKPLLAASDAAGFFVYSVAINGLDDAGQPTLVFFSTNPRGHFGSFGFISRGTDDVGFRIWVGEEDAAEKSGAGDAAE